MKKKPVKSRCEKKVEKQRVRLVRPGSPLGARGSTNQQDKLTKEDKLTEKNPLREDKLIKGEVLGDKPRRILTRPGRASGPERIYWTQWVPGLPGICVRISQLRAFAPRFRLPFGSPGVIFCHFG